MPHKKRIVRKRHQRFVKIANPLIAPFVLNPWGFERKRVSVDAKGPFLLVSNHVTAYDPIYVTSVFNEQIYYVASELIFSKGFISRVLEYCFAPIPKTKSQTDITAIKTMVQVVNEGGNVGVFVEGNSTMNGQISNVPAAIGKLVLLLKIPLVIFNIHGGYLSNPRWSRHKRKMKITGNIKKVYYYDDYKDMSADEVNQLIIDGINVDAYNDNDSFEYSGNHLADGLERLIFTCPKCHGVNSSSTSGNRYKCDTCAFTMTYDAHGYLHSEIFAKPLSTTELDHQNKLNYQEILIKDPTFSLSVEGVFTEVFRRRRKHFGRAKVTLSHEGLEIKFKRNAHETIFYPFDSIDTMAIQQKEVLVMYIKNEQTKMLYIENTNRVSAYQFVVTLQIMQNIARHQASGDVPRLSKQEMGL